MKGKILKKVLAAALVLTLVSGGMPIAPGSDMFGNTVITANAVGGTLTGEGTVESPYVISDANDWNTFAESVNSGTLYSGKTVIPIDENI